MLVLSKPYHFNSAELRLHEVSTMTFNIASFWSAIQKTSWSDFHHVFDAVNSGFQMISSQADLLNLPWGWLFINSLQKDPSKMDIDIQASILSTAIHQKEFREPDFEVRDRSEEIQDDHFSWKEFPSLVLQKFKESYPGTSPLVYSGDYILQEPNGFKRQFAAVLSADSSYTLQDFITADTLQGTFHAESQIKFQDLVSKEIIQEEFNDSDSGVPSELKTSGTDFISPYGEVHKNSVPTEILHRLPFLFINAKDLHPALLQEQWKSLQDLGSYLQCNEFKEIKMKFIQRFHFNHSAINGIRRFIQDLKVQGIKQKMTSVDSDSSEEQMKDVQKMVHIASTLTPSYVQDNQKDASEIKVPSEAGSDVQMVDDSQAK
jgi:hypothetical protein